MFIDASALVAILTHEPGADELLDRIRLSRRRLVSAMSIYEASLAIARINLVGADVALHDVEQFLARINASEAPIDLETGKLAVRAFAKYGRGNHPAKLNMGDCFAYACATQAGVNILYKGDDFAQTDLA